MIRKYKHNRPVKESPIDPSISPPPFELCPGRRGLEEPRDEKRRTHATEAQNRRRTTVDRALLHPGGAEEN
jgi:hypothetical protein